MAKYEVWMTARPDIKTPVLMEIRAHNRISLGDAFRLVYSLVLPVKIYGHDLKRACVGFIAKIPPRAGGTYEIRCNRKDVGRGG